MEDDELLLRDTLEFGLRNRVINPVVNIIMNRILAPDPASSDIGFISDNQGCGDGVRHHPGGLVMIRYGRNNLNPIRNR